MNLAYESATFWKWIFWIRYESGIVKALNPDISYPVTKQDQAQFFTVNNLFKMATSTHALLPIFPEKSWVLEWIQIRVGFVLDTCGRANSIRIRILVDVEMFESREKKLWIKKYPDMCGGSLRNITWKISINRSPVTVKYRRISMKTWSDLRFFLPLVHGIL